MTWEKTSFYEPIDEYSIIINKIPKLIHVNNNEVLADDNLRTDNIFIALNLAKDENIISTLTTITFTINFIFYDGML